MIAVNESTTLSYPRALPWRIQNEGAGPLSITLVTPGMVAGPAVRSRADPL